MPAARAARHQILVHVVGQADDHAVGLRVVDGLVEVGGPVWDVPLFGKCLGPFRSARVDDLDPVAVALAVKRHGVEHADEPGAEHGDFVHENFLLVH